MHFFQAGSFCTRPQLLAETESEVLAEARAQRLKGLRAHSVFGTGTTPMSVVPCRSLYWVSARALCPTWPIDWHRAIEGSRCPNAADCLTLLRLVSTPRRPPFTPCQQSHVAVGLRSLVPHLLRDMSWPPRAAVCSLAPVPTTYLVLCPPLHGTSACPRCFRCEPLQCWLVAVWTAQGADLVQTGK